MGPHRGLTVREHERQQIEMPVEFIICDEHRPQVRFSTSSSVIDQFGVGGLTVDLSAGGLGFVAKQFLPRHCEGMVRVFEPGLPKCSFDGESTSAREHAPAYIEHRAKVRRVRMNSRDGQYAIGLAFLNPTPKLEARVSELLSMMHQAVVERETPPSAKPEASDA